MSVYQDNEIEKEIDCNPEIHKNNTELSEIKMENATNQTPSSSCPFNHLHATIEWEILRNLNYKDILNLALTCRKWFKTISTAPSSAKPTVQCDEVITWESGLILKGKDYICAIKKPNSCLFGKLECLALMIDLNTRPDLLEFLIENRSKLHVNRLYMKFPVKCEKQASLMVQLADISPKIYFDNGDNQSMMENKLVINRIVENTTSHQTIENSDCLDGSMTNIIIKQYIEGKRPNLECVTFGIISDIDVETFHIDMLISEFKDSVQGKQCIIDSIGFKRQDATIVVDGLPNLIFLCVDRFVFMKREGCSRRFLDSAS